MRPKKSERALLTQDVSYVVALVLKSKDIFIFDELMIKPKQYAVAKK
jgi:hypothetical protein